MKTSGRVDLCGPELVEGWLYCDDWDGEAIRLQVYIDDQLMGECVADRFRQDLREAGFGDDRCGFSFEVPPDIEGIDFSATKLRLTDSPVYLLPSDDTAIAPRSGGRGELYLPATIESSVSAASKTTLPSQTGKRRFSVRELLTTAI
jgi:hypothetical protein